MKIHRVTDIEGVRVLEFDQHVDARGTFEEAFNSRPFGAIGLPTDWAQDNMSISFGKVIRGLHVQRKNPQGKLVRCFAGSIYDVGVDVRKGSKTFGRVFGMHLGWDKPYGLWLPPGVAHGFCVTAQSAMVYYKCSSHYDPETDGGIAWNDPELDIQWPMLVGTQPIVSPKDQALPRLADFQPVEV
jgi:dTDP-4-dehydrorhamnose 3,5-epimerase